MSLSKELQEKINILFESDDETRKKLLACDADTIRQIGSLSQKGINPEDIIYAYESNDTAMARLYENAKKIVELKKLYKDLCLEYSKVKRNDNEER